MILKNSGDKINMPQYPGFEKLTSEMIVYLVSFFNGSVGILSQICVSVRTFWSHSNVLV